MRPRMCLKEDRKFINGFLKEFGISVQMRLYTMHKREFVLVYLTFLGALGLSLLIGLAGPAMTLTAKQSATQLTTTTQQLNKTSSTPQKLNDNNVSLFQLKTPPLSRYSQQLWLIAEVLVDVGDDQSFKKQIHFGVSIEGIKENKENKDISPLNIHQNRSATLYCSSDRCNTMHLSHLSIYHYTRYIITLDLYNLKQLYKFYQIKDIIFYIRTYNPAYTKMELWCRFVYLLAAFCVTCWLAHSLRKYPLSDWSIEQKYLSILLPLLLLYDDPIYPLTLLIDSSLPELIDAILQTTFLATLLLVWLCVYHGLRQNDRSFSTFYLPKLTVVGGLWLVVCLAAGDLRMKQTTDPLFTPGIDDLKGVKGVLFAVCGCVYVFYLLYLVFKAYGELHSLPYFDLRLKFLTSMTAIAVTVATVVSIAAPYPPIGYLSHLSIDLSPYNSSLPFTLTYTVINIYLFTIAYVYRPSERALMETHIKDNPALSMVNDSDEDIYTQDDDFVDNDFNTQDDFRQPLNRPARE